MIEKKVKTPSGYDCKFWRITFFSIDVIKGEVDVSISGFKNEKMAKSAVDHKSALTTYDYTFQVQDFSKEVQGKVEEGVAAAYKKILSMPEFQD